MRTADRPLSRQITYLFFPAVNWQTSGLSLNLLTWLVYRIIRKKSNERVTPILRKDVLKNRFISDYFMLHLIHQLSSLLFGVKFRAKFETRFTLEEIVPDS